MDELISRAAAKFQACNWNVKPNDVIFDGIKEAIKTQLDMAPAVDAVPVVRCRDCKWWNGSTLGAAHRCAALHIATTGDFYCAAAERKSNAYADQSGAEYADNPTV
jgi:hypothetical protein